MNAVLGTIQHVKAEKSLEGLKQLSAPAAKRDGIKQEIPAKDVVPGAILELEAGDMKRLQEGSFVIIPFR